MDKRLLILDLDETLIHASEVKLDRDADFTVAYFWVYKRPYLRQFLEFAFEQFEVAVWTSSSRPYAEAIVNAVIPPNCSLKFLWARERCTRRLSYELQSHYWVKDLKKVQRAMKIPLEQILMVDDSPEKLERQYGNLVRVSPFVGEEPDEELNLLPDFLGWLDEHDSVRSIEKRRWKSRLLGGELEPGADRC